MSLTNAIIDDEAGLAEIRLGWDALAVASGQSYRAPAWMLPWWRHSRPAEAGLRVLAVLDGAEVIGLAPLFAATERRRAAAYEFLTADFSPPVGPLVAAGREPEVADAFKGLLASVAPRPTEIALWLRPGADPVATELSESWAARRPWVYSRPPVPVPVVSLDGLDYDAWFAGRSSKFRQESRRMRRRIDDEGAEFAAVGEADLAEAVDAFVALHGDRWKDRGGSGALIGGLREMLTEAFGELAPAGRLRIFTIKVEGAVIAVNILVAAGSEVGGWNSGFHPDWGRYSPSMLLTLHAIEDATERGDKRFSLGPGDGGYKRRLADSAEEIARVTSVAKGPSYPLTRLRLEGADRRRDLAARLSPEAKARLRRLLRR